MWTDFRITTIEDQQKLLVPLNRDTEKIYYNLRILIDSPVLSESRAWAVSKVNRISPNGLIRITLAQDNFDQNHDLIETETDELGRTRVVGMWADGKPYSVQPPDLRDEFPKVGTYAEITCSGVKPFLKVGGSYKTLTINFFKEEDPVPFQPGDWSFTIDGESADNLIILKKTDEDNKIKIKFTGDDSYIGKIITCVFKSLQGVKSSFDFHIESL